ncbi:hypothetical protein T4D_10664 [Trichinella pseudospiralis]|uniref:Uncharacterized protein n=1 Tax=Trichinella pseudospiralis TaxID=6337 RepID=A0A0V1FUV9_TRIPS|nr:hypothetical protein T4D_10664 [Trichinella pseudospiralis]
MNSRNWEFYQSFQKIIDWELLKFYIPSIRTIFFALIIKALNFTAPAANFEVRRTIIVNVENHGIGINRVLVKLQKMAKCSLSFSKQLMK